MKQIEILGVFYYVIGDKPFYIVENINPEDKKEAGFFLSNDYYLNLPPHIKLNPFRHNVLFKKHDNKYIPVLHKNREQLERLKFSIEALL